MKAPPQKAAKAVLPKANNFNEAKKTPAGIRGSFFVSGKTGFCKISLKKNGYSDIII